MARGSLTAVAFGAALVACWWCCFMQVDGQTVWPKPQSQSDGSASYSLSPSSFAFEAVGFNSDILLQAVRCCCCCCAWPRSILDGDNEDSGCLLSRSSAIAPLPSIAIRGAIRCRTPTPTRERELLPLPRSLASYEPTLLLLLSMLV